MKRIAILLFSVIFAVMVFFSYATTLTAKTEGSQAENDQSLNKEIIRDVARVFLIDKSNVLVLVGKNGIYQPRQLRHVPIYLDGEGIVIKTDIGANETPYIYSEYYVTWKIGLGKVQKLHSYLKIIIHVRSLNDIGNGFPK